ncbi:hypothetical protein D3C74_436410 [compost metagenome]
MRTLKEKKFRIQMSFITWITRIPKKAAWLYCLVTLHHKALSSKLVRLMLRLVDTTKVLLSALTPRSKRSKALLTAK